MIVTSEDSVRVLVILYLLNHSFLKVMEVEFSMFFIGGVNTF